MSVSIEGGESGRRKATSADLNLVPYIDLLTCMVAFLLITAVWTQLASVEVEQQTPGTSPSESTEPPATKLAVTVTSEGFSLVTGADVEPLPRKAGGYDFEALRAAPARVKARQPDRTDLQIASEDASPFDILARTMDVALGARFVDVSLVDAGG